MKKFVLFLALVEISAVAGGGKAVKHFKYLVGKSGHQVARLHGQGQPSTKKSEQKAVQVESKKKESKGK